MSCFYFSEDYSSAKQRFREACDRTGVPRNSLALSAKSLDENPLSIEIAWLGDPDPRRVVIHCSGVHGVEAFPGAAVQLKLLEDPPSISADGALILVHVLNPYGMDYLRRFNEENVDLNRNFLNDDESYTGSADAYRSLNQFLNPSTPASFDCFTPRLLYHFTRHRFQLKAAVAAGQYEYPRGLFFGGKELQEGPRLYRSWLEEHLSQVQYLLVVDVHTGLGRWCQESLLLRRHATESEKLQAALEKKLIEDVKQGPVDYQIRGHHSCLYGRAGDQAVDFITQEFGTYPPQKVLYALREENRHQHYGTGKLDHPSKLRLREVFSPASTDWRDSVFKQGLALARRGCEHMFKVPALKL